MAVETVGVGELKRRLKETVETDVSASEVNDVIESLQAVVEDAIASGQAVNLFGLVKITPKYKAAVKAAKNQPNPFKPGETFDRAAKPARIVVKALPLARLKNAVPEATSAAGKRVR
jgi:nucleoid DNA-binding protein